MKKIEKIKERMEMHKKIMIAIFINGIVVEIYSMVVMFIFQDLSALYSLIGAVIGVSLSYAIYCAKSYFGKREEVRMELEKHIFDSGLNDSCDDIEQPEEEKLDDPELP